MTSTSWPDFYRGRGGYDYEKYCAERYKPFLGLVAARMRTMLDHSDEDIISVELGAGTATVSTIIGRAFPQANLIVTDIDMRMIDMAASRLAEACLEANVLLYQADVTNSGCVPDNFDPTVVHSHGLLEHFDDATVKEIVDRHRPWYQVHYIPGLYPEPSFGDERLLPIEHWVGLLRPSRYYTFNGGLDYALVFHPQGYH